jgi:hypothetical protein
MNKCKILTAASMILAGVPPSQAGTPTPGAYVGISVGASHQSAKVKTQSRKVKTTEDATGVRTAGGFSQAEHLRKIKLIEDAEVADPAVAFPDALFAGDNHDDANLLNAAITPEALSQAFRALFEPKLKVLKEVGYSEAELPVYLVTAAATDSIDRAATSFLGVDLLIGGNFPLTWVDRGAGIDIVRDRASVLDDLLGAHAQGDLKTTFNAGMRTAYPLMAEKLGQVAPATFERTGIEGEFTIPEESRNAHKTRAVFGLNVGYLCLSCNKIGFGFEAFGEFGTGNSVKVKEIGSSKATTDTSYGNTWNLGAEQSNPRGSLTLKQGISYGIRLRPGFAIGCCFVSVPFEVSVSKYSLRTDRADISSFDGVVPTRQAVLEQDGATYSATYSLKKVELAGDSTAATTASADESPIVGSSTKTVSKTKPGFGVGIGVDVFLKDNLILGVCCMYQLPRKFTAKFPKFTSNAICGDGEHLGTEHEVSVSNVKTSIALKYKA